jgi:hypothetical protein
MECLRCNYVWKQRKDGRVKACPRCKRYDWDMSNVNEKMAWDSVSDSWVPVTKQKIKYQKLNGL